MPCGKKSPIVGGSGAVNAASTSSGTGTSSGSLSVQGTVDTRPGTGGNPGAGVIVNETWEGKSTSYLQYEDDPLEGAGNLRWNVALSIQGCDRNSYPVNCNPWPNPAMQNRTEVGIDLYDPPGMGRRVARFWVSPQSADEDWIGARLEMGDGSQSKYNFLRAYAGQTLYGRYYFYIPGPAFDYDASGGDFLSLMQIKTTELYGNAGVQFNLEYNASGVDPISGQSHALNQVIISGASNLGANTIRRNRVVLTFDTWHRVDFVWVMKYSGGSFQIFLDGVEVGYITGVLADNPGISGRAEQGYFYPMILYGNLFKQHPYYAYLGDVLLSTTPIT